jgi:glycosyltransferase involved in cell wall biosynthesis
MKIAFYAPMNAPDDGPPSGDRLIAQQLIKGLGDLGHEVEIASRLKTWASSPEALADLHESAAMDVARLHAAPFDAWFTYHVYYKSPDLIGPWVARARGIPYFIAEASLSPKRAEGPWAEHHTAAREAMAVAARIFCVSQRDRPALEEAGLANKLVDLPPWVDASAWTRPRPEPGDGPIRLVTTAMMREGDKLESYQLIAKSLPHLPCDWRLTIFGDGPAREKVEKLFKKHEGQVTFAGAVDPFTLAGAYDEADLFIWPGIGEGLGMAYLEAQAVGLPCVACNGPGPQDAMDDASARFTQDTPAAFAWAITDLAQSAARRETMSKAARRLVATRFSKERYLHTLRATIEDQCL